MYRSIFENNQTFFGWLSNDRPIDVEQPPYCYFVLYKFIILIEITYFLKKKSSQIFSGALIAFLPDNRISRPSCTIRVRKFKVKAVVTSVIMMMEPES